MYVLRKFESNIRMHSYDPYLRYKSTTARMSRASGDSYRVGAVAQVHIQLRFRLKPNVDCKPGVNAQLKHEQMLDNPQPS